jgi:Virulence factor
VARYRIVRWRDIPAVVEASDESGTVRLPLSQRFQDLIDGVAMRLGATGTEAYLDGWEQDAEVERSGAAQGVAEAVAAELESAFGEYVRRHLL